MINVCNIFIKCSNNSNSSYIIDTVILVLECMFSDIQEPYVQYLFHLQNFRLFHFTLFEGKNIFDRICCDIQSHWILNIFYCIQYFFIILLFCFFLFPCIIYIYKCMLSCAIGIIYN